MFSLMAAPDGSMTFDWIFMAIVVIPMIFAAWELYKTNKGISARQGRGPTRL